MFDQPKTAEDAAKYRYGTWAGNPRGQPHDPSRCAYEVSAGAGSFLYCQCSRKAGYGPAALYCKQHAKRVSD